MTFQYPDRLFHLANKLRPSPLIGAGQKSQTGIRNIAPLSGKKRCRVSHEPVLIIRTAVHHILPYDHAEPVAMIIPPLRLDLDMLSEHIEAHFLHFHNIKDKSLVGGRRIQSVRPVTLIEHTVLKPCLSVQADARNPGLVLFHRKGAKRKITFYRILSHLNRKIIQPGHFTRPELTVRKGYRNLTIGKTAGFRQTVIRRRACRFHRTAVSGNASVFSGRSLIQCRLPNPDFHRRCGIPAHRNPHAPAPAVRQ